MIKCKLCGEYIKDNEEKVPYKNRYVHPRCFNASMKAISDGKSEKLEKEKAEKKEKPKRKPKVELKDPVSEEEYQDKKEFYEEVRSLYSEEELPSKIYAITENIRTKYGFTFKGMTDTLKYLVLKEKELTGDIVGIIPYYYSEAEKYYKEVQTIEQRNQNVDVRNMYQEKVVHIKPKKRVVKQLKFDD